MDLHGPEASNPHLDVPFGAHGQEVSGFGFSAITFSARYDFCARPAIIPN